MSDGEPKKNAQDILNAISKVTKERESLGKQQVPQVQASPKKTSVPSENATVEDLSDNQEGTVFLLWFDKEDSKRYPDYSKSPEGVKEQGIYPMKSPVYLAKHIDFHNPQEKQNALQQAAELVEMFENDSIEIRGRGKYAILVGKYIQIEVEKKIVIK